MSNENCEGGWDSHRWEVGKQNRHAGELTIFCNQCGCEEENTVYLYDRENCKEEITLEVLEATA